MRVVGVPKETERARCGGEEGDGGRGIAGLAAFHFHHDIALGDVITGNDLEIDNAAGDAIQFFAVDGERVVGWADIFPGWAHAVRHCGTLGMGVHPGYRGQGLGTRLLRACIDKAWRKGITRIELEARSDNRRAIALYEKVGFEREALKSRALCFDGVYHDAVQMRLLRGDA